MILYFADVTGKSEENTDGSCSKKKNKKKVKQKVLFSTGMNFM